MKNERLKQHRDLALSLNRALLGKITASMREISIRDGGDTWLITFIVDGEDETTDEAIEDAVADFESLQLHGLPLKLTALRNNPRLNLVGPDYVVFRRRERLS
ncbi:MAG: hypothetical protein V4466_10915 [Pseudomonadota bacterium]